MLVVSPVRELSMQIHREACKLAEGLDVEPVLMVGGASWEDAARADGASIFSTITGYQLYIMLGYIYIRMQPYASHSVTLIGH